jgi:hypothetical protein
MDLRRGRSRTIEEMGAGIIKLQIADSKLQIETFLNLKFEI